jgi:hypothetical protein
MSATPADPAGGTPRLAGVVRAYQGAATLLLNFLVLLVAANLVLAAAFAVTDRRGGAAGPTEPFAADGAPLPGPKRTTFQLEWFAARAYGPPASHGRAAQVLDDFHDLADAGFAYQPWTQFAEPPFDGALVHVEADDRGLLRRRTRAAPGGHGAPLSVFVLGGSTTFGYYAADDETWPSALAEVLAARAPAGVRVEVANYGRGYYNPSQEAVLLLDLFKSGHRPDLVVFMDGVNWGPAEDVPQFTKRLASGFRSMQAPPPPSPLDAVAWLPMARLARRFGSAPAPEPASAERRDTAQVVERFLSSWRVADSLCRLYGSQCRFFLQPDPVFNYRAGLYRRALPASFLEERAQRADFYARLAGQTAATDLTGLFAEWGADHQAVVDDVHYSPAFNRFLAEQVAGRVDLDALLRARTTRPVTPTGARRAVYPVAPMSDPGRGE